MQPGRTAPHAFGCGARIRLLSSWVRRSRTSGITAITTFCDRARTTGLLAALVVLVLGGGFGHAADLAAAERLYHDGRFAKAAELGRAAGSADGHALAAKATLVRGAYLARQDERAKLFRRAAGDARNALALDPDHVDARLQLAIALGHIGAHEGPITAHLDGYAREAKEHIDRALTLAPDYAWVHGVLGMWHLQIVRHGGPALARELYAASRQDGRAHCERARTLAPGELALRYGCAVSLLELDAEAFGRRAIDELEHIVRSPADDAAGRLVQDEARRRLSRSDPAAAG